MKSISPAVILAVSILAVLNVSADTHRVPQDFSLLKTAIDNAADNDSIICTDVNDTGNISISKNLYISGYNSFADSVVANVTITVTDAICEFRNISIKGINGIDGTGGTALSPASCPSVTAGTDGSDALIITNSEVTIMNCVIAGGNGGNGGYAKIWYSNGMLELCDDAPPGECGNAIYCDNSKMHITSSTLRSGNRDGDFYGIGGQILNNSQVDTSGVVADSLYVDESSDLTNNNNAIIFVDNHRKSIGSFIKFNAKNGYVEIDANTKTAQGCRVDIFQPDGRHVRSINIVNNQTAGNDNARIYKIQSGAFIARILYPGSRQAQVFMMVR